jgi:hypothetical protein
LNINERMTVGEAGPALCGPVVSPASVKRLLKTFDNFLLKNTDVARWGLAFGQKQKARQWMPGLWHVITPA